MSQVSVKHGYWNLVKDELRRIFPKDIYEMWFAPLRLMEESPEALVLAAPNEFAAIWVQDNYLDLIRQKLARAAGRPVKVEISPDHTSGSSAAEAETDRLIPPRRMDGRRPGARAPFGSHRHGKLKVNPRNTFDAFVIGPSNQLAHAASVAVANTPGATHNPLFIYGDTGLGKTHLMHAIGTRIVEQMPGACVVYVSCEKFTNQFMRAIQENTLPQFRRLFRKVDVLLIDDVHFLSGKERTQDEFFHTFNDLFESQKQICLSSDRPASEIAKLESRLVSRFQWGMVADIQPPDLETRTAILANKARARHYHLDEEIIQYLAQSITRNVRRMEGALIKVGAYAALMNKPLNLPTVENLIRDILQEEAHNRVTIEKIQKKVAQFYDLRMSDMLSKRRPSHIAFPRQVAMYLSRLYTSHPLKEIGEAFGGRDHGTVIHACKTVENMMEQDKEVKHKVEYLGTLVTR